MTVYRRPDPIPLHRSQPVVSAAGLHAVRPESTDLNRLAARQIFVAIEAGRFPPGSILPNEHQLATDLGVSRTALREAIKGLASKGIVETRRKRGTQVVDRRHWNQLDADLIAWSRREGGQRIADELWVALVEAVAAVAAHAAASRATGLADRALVRFGATADPLERRAAFAELVTAVAAAGGNRFLQSLTASCLAGLIAEDTAFLDRRLAGMDATVLGEMLASIRDGRSSAARAAALRLGHAGTAPLPAARQVTA